jgi:hypothetical protein
MKRKIIGLAGILLAIAVSAYAVTQVRLKPDAANDAVCTVFGTPSLGMSCGKTTAPATKLDVVGTVTATAFSGPLSGNAATATALAANPTDCSANQFANAIAASGNLTCSAVPNAATTASSANTTSAIVARDGSGNFAAGTITAALTGNAATATALAADPSDCILPNVALGIGASGAAACSQPSDVTGNAATSTALAADPSDCTLPNVALGVNASGTAQCSQPSDVTGNAATATVAAGIASKTLAELLADTPSAIGKLWYCSDCSLTAVAVSTAATPGGVADIKDRTAVVQ